MLRKRFIYRCFLLLGGLYSAAMGIWRLAESAIFVHEAAVIPCVVVDVRERPFEGYLEMLRHGNLPWEGAVAHQPHVRYELASHPVVDTTLPDLDSQDYDRGQQVEIILDPRKPYLRHINKFKFIWGQPLLQLGQGLILLLLWRLTRPRRRRSLVKQAVRRTRDKMAQAASEAVVEQVMPAAGKRRSTPEELVLELAEAAAAPPKRRRSAKPKDPTAPKKPRKRKAPDTPPKKRTRKQEKTS